MELPFAPWLRRAVLAALIVLALFALGRTLGRAPVASLEGAVFDLSQRAGRASAADSVVWVDTGSSGDRGVLASAVRAAGRAPARAVAVLATLEGAEVNADLERVRGFLDSPESHADSALQTRLTTWLGELDHDARLADALAATPSVLAITPGDTQLRLPGLGATPARLAELSGISAPLARFAVAAKALALEPSLPPDADGIRRREALAVRVPGAVLPSFALAAWLVAAGDKPADLRFEDRALVATPSGRRLAVGALATVLPLYSAAAGESGGLARIPVETLLQPSADVSHLKDRIVVIGHGADVATALGARPAAEAAAERIASLDAGNYALVPPWAGLVRVLTFLLAVLWASEGMWRLSAAKGPGAAIGATLVLVALAIVGEIVLLVQFSAWIALVLPALSTIAAAAGVGLLGPLIGASPGERKRGSPVLLVPEPQLASRKAPLAQVESPPTVAMPADRRSTRATRAPIAGEPAGAVAQSGSLRQLSNSLKAAEPSRTDVADLLLGRAKRAPKPKLGRYELLEELGRGAMGTVYLGRDPRLNRVVAIKAIPLAEAVDETNLAETRARFFREAEAAGRLKHPGIITVYDAGEEGALAYIAMEHVQGEPLLERTVSDRLLPARQSLELVAKLADALDYAHSQGVIHRDVKPGNVIYDPATLEPKIMDFGIARFSDSTATRTGIVLGTPSFMAPEQLEGRNVTGRSDLFSLGVTLFQLLTGQLPFRADSMTGLMDKIANAPHPPLRTIRPDLPAGVGAVIDRALQKDPERRFPTGAEMAKALRAVAKSLAA
jgi:eukaryotic-like serine/threonine-protein kinase